MNTPHPFFSVIVPTLNEEKNLPILLNGLMEQNFAAFEIILIDGGSRDKTISLMKEFQQAFKKKDMHLEFHHSPGKNVPFQRNLGSQKASGTYFVFFDADVAIGPDFLHDIHTHISKTHDQFLTTWCIPDDHSFIYKILSFIMNWSIILAIRTPKPLIPGFNIIMSRAAFNKAGGFDDTIVLGEDHALAQAARKVGITISFLRRPELIFSVRRFRSEGHLVVIVKYIWSTLYIWFKGPIKHQIYEYKMGGETPKTT